MTAIGFDNDLYLRIQSERIRERISQFGGKLYLEFGGKLFDDFHASRVLPGFKPDSKITMLMQLREQTEIVIAINAEDIEKNKVRGDLGITYDQDLLRLVDAFTSCGLYVGSVVMTRWADQPAAVAYEKKLKTLGLRVYRHYPIPGYPSALSLIVSDEGYGRNDYIETSRPLVVVTAPGPGSGKMATCLSQLYHEQKRGVQAGYAKFETFPVWDLPLDHPVNLAYEAATADLSDVNMLDPFHLAAYREEAVNYNRDVEVFPVLRAMFQRIFGESPYQSPTDMGVNMIRKCIVDDAAVCAAARQEIIRRWYEARCENRKGNASGAPADKIALLMEKAGISAADRPVIGAANELAHATGLPAAAMELPGGRVITGKTSPLLGASSALILNALKELAGIPDEIKLISPALIEPVMELKVKYLGNHNPLLHIDEILIVLSIEAQSNQAARAAYACLPQLRGLEAHSSVILSQVDAGTFRKLGVNLTCEPSYHSKKLYHK